MKYLTLTIGIAAGSCGIIWQQDLAGIVGVAAIFLQIWKIIDNSDRKLLDHEIQRVYEDPQPNQWGRNQQPAKSGRTSHENTHPPLHPVPQTLVNNMMTFSEFRPDIIGMQPILRNYNDAA